jgi:SAM-dependent methyltransferase
MTQPLVPPAAYYDRIAGVYDTLFVSPEEHLENLNAIERLDYECGNMLDVGCGTGLLLDYISCSDYVGIDPSAGMLARHRKRHPGRTVIQVPLETYSEGPIFENIACLFGSANHISADALRTLPWMLVPGGGKLTVMLFKPGYVPETYAKTGGGTSHIYHPEDIFADLIEGDVTEYGNYLIFHGVR